MLKSIKLIIILLSISFILSSCSTGDSGGSSSATAADDSENPISGPPATDPPDSGQPEPGEPSPVPEPVVLPPGNSSIKLAAVLDNNLYFVADSGLDYKTSGAISQVSTATYAVDSEVVIYDASGDVLDTEELPVEPTRIIQNDEGIYYCHEYTAEESFALGALPRVHSEMYKDMDMISHMSFNQHECKDIVYSGSSVFAIDQNEAYRKISGAIENPIHVENNQFVIHSRNALNRTVMINDSTETYLTNNILAAKQWLEHNGIYYSGNGYTWSEAEGLIENATALQDFQSYPYPIPETDMPYGEAPVLLKIGIYMNNLIYAECNTGLLYEYNPADNTLIQRFRLYIGEGTRSSGINKREELNPVLSDGFLYYSDAGVVMRMNLETGLPEIFIAQEGEVMEF